MGDSPPVCQKPYTLPLKHYNWVQQEIKTLEHAGVIRKSISPWASPIVIVPKKSTPGEPPCRRMCIDFRKLNDLQTEVCHADSQTGGNISLVPLTKIDEMYGRLKGAKYFTTLDLRSGYYHIGLLENSKAKMANNRNFTIGHILCSNLHLVCCQMGNFYYFSHCLACWLSKPWHFVKFKYFLNKICHFLNVSKGVV